MAKIFKVLGWVVLVGVVLLSIDYSVVRYKERQATRAVTNLGGNVGSLPAWPLGTEYCITFYRPLSEAELNSLSGLNNLRGVVLVRFVDCNLTAAEARQIKRFLPDCFAFERNGDVMGPLPED